MLIESISREPLQFQIFAFDLPKMRYALQVSDEVYTFAGESVCGSWTDLID